MLRQNEQHEQIQIMAIRGPLCTKTETIMETSSNQPCGRDSECQTVRFQKFFGIVNFHFLDGDVPHSPFYDVCISQLIPFVK